MQKKFFFFGFILLLTSTLQHKAQYEIEGNTYKQCFVGSSFFIIDNLKPENYSSDLYYLNLGCNILIAK
jgi:hypothetical protein